MTPEAFPRRVAVIHDWLTGMRGGEKVLEAILELFPAADVYTLFHFPGSVSPAIEAHPIRTSSLQRLASGLNNYRTLLPLFPRAVGEWDLGSYELIVSSSHCVAKGARGPGVPHISYCHTPMRYVWDRFDDYFPRSKPLIRGIASLAAPALRRWDVSTSSRVDAFVANSHFVQGRIQKYYGRESRVIHPFVDASFLEGRIEQERLPFHLIVSALVPYKNIALAIRAFAKSGRTLRIIGGGPMRDELERQAPPNVQFMGLVSDQVIRENLLTATSLILPGIEDFGITPLEAMATGTPVVALRGGGALDTVVEGATGWFFDRPEPDSLATALDRVETTGWDREAIRRHASNFSRERFLTQMRESVVDLMTRKT